MSDPDPKLSAVQRLLDVMAALRGDGGCPWDRKQTHRSLVPYLIEEAYEVAEAIEGGQVADLREELGDLLLQVVFHARIAEEAGEFDFAAVAGAIADKLTERHPHVFAGLKVDSPEELRRLWHASKMRTRDSALDGIPDKLPALQRAAKVSAAAARTGFEWRRMDEILDKAGEELREFSEAVAARERNRAAAGNGGDGGGAPPSEEMETELGDLLFALVQVARWQRIDPEAALRRATRKFGERFRYMERRLRDEGETRVPERWEVLWAAAKAAIPG